MQGDIAVITTFAYDKNGKMQWYYSDGKLTNNGMAWKGAMLKVDNIFTIGSSAYADVYNFTEKAAANEDGNGVVVDPIKRAGAELKTKGALAGYVVAVQTDATFTKTLNLYAFKLDLDEGSGIWVSPSTNNSYNLNVHKIQHPNGLTKMGPLGTSNVGVVQSTGNHELLSQKLLSEENKALAAEMADIAARMIKNIKDAAANQ